MRKYEITEKRGKALQGIRRLIRREDRAKSFDANMLEGYAERIQAADGDTEAVRLIRQAKGAPVSVACSLLRQAEHICFVIGDERRRRVGAQNVAKAHEKPVWNLGLTMPRNSPEDILCRVMDVADEELAVLIREKCGNFVVRKASRKYRIRGEVIGYYDVRADARHVLADIKEAMA